jgi:addiction module HigA family antidote
MHPHRTIPIPTHQPPTSIGEMLEEEFRKPLGLTQAEFAEKLGIDRVRYSSLANGRRALSLDTAQRLSRVLGTSVEFWLNLQHVTDVYNATRAPLSPEIAALLPVASKTKIPRSRRIVSGRANRA